MATYSLYELIKDKLSPAVRHKLENQMRYNQLVNNKNKEREDF